jgi:hypothetical protein
MYGQGQKKLLFAPFYFWNSGTEMQKSREGLLRTLLYEILRSEPILIPKLFPDHWEKAKESSMNLSQDLPITYSDVLAAFDILLNHAEIYSAHRFCFFIDGLDEYEGITEKPSSFSRAGHSLATLRFVFQVGPGISSRTPSLLIKNFGCKT